MVDIRSWKVWVIFALALGTLACANREERRERKEQAREERRERAEARRAERMERNEGRRPARETRRDEPKVAESLPREREQQTRPAPAASLTPTSTAPAAALQEGKVIFVRTAVGGSAITASVFDVTDSGPPTFINHVQRNYKVVYPVKPGLHTFMVVSEAADFIQVEVLPGKTYYAIVEPRMGVMRARFSFRPVLPDDRRIAAWERAKETRVAPSAVSWAEKNAPDIANKRERYWIEWSRKSESERPMLRAEDGR